MALIKDQKTRHEIPHEEGQWIEVRPIRNADLIGLDLASTSHWQLAITLLERVVVGWSYEDEPTPENVRILDMRTTNWLGGILLDEIGDNDEKNASTTSS